MDKEAFRKLLVQWAHEDVYIGQLTWEEGDSLAEYLAKWYAAQQSVQADKGYCSCQPAQSQVITTGVGDWCLACSRPCR